MASPEALAAFKKGLRNASKQRKSDDIVEFMRAHWRMFCSSRNTMLLICKELEQQGDLTPGALADALGVDRMVRFKKVKMVDMAKLVINPANHPLYRKFKELEAVSKDGLVLVFVCGERSLVMTNTSVPREPDAVIMDVVDAAGNITSILGPGVAARCMKVFKHEGVEYE